MVIKIENFGPIKEFEFDLSKDLTFIYGMNNIGKSYAMKVIYLLIKCFYQDDSDFSTSYPISGNENLKINEESTLKRNIESKLSQYINHNSMIELNSLLVSTFHKLQNIAHENSKFRIKFKTLSIIV